LISLFVAFEMGTLMLPDRATYQLSLVITAIAVFIVRVCRIGWINVDNARFAPMLLLTMHKIKAVMIHDSIGPSFDDVEACAP